MNIEDINRDREKFLDNIQKSLEGELEKIGLVLINVNITDITDESGYIEAIGRKAASEAVQQADVLVPTVTDRRFRRTRVRPVQRRRLVTEGTRLAGVFQERQSPGTLGFRPARRRGAIGLDNLPKSHQARLLVVRH